MAKKPARRSLARVRRLQFRLTRSKQLQITLRKFRTKKVNRSKRVHQLVFPVRLRAYREVAIVSQRYRRMAKRGPRKRLLALAPTILLMLGVGGTAYFGLHLKTHVTLNLVNSKVSADAVVQPVAKPQPKVLPRATPVEVRIPKIAVDAPINPVGLQDDGTLAMPDSFWSANWYDGSPTPGELGPSVIAGHVDQVGGIAVFWRIRELVPGDTIYIDRADGTTASFKVLELQQYPQDNFPTQDVYGDINYAGLRLITCGGSFNTDTHHYSDNTVVYAALQ